MASLVLRLFLWFVGMMPWVEMDFGVFCAAFGASTCLTGRELLPVDCSLLAREFGIVDVYWRMQEGRCAQAMLWLGVEKSVQKVGWSRIAHCCAELRKRDGRYIERASYRNKAD